MQKELKPTKGCRSKFAPFNPEYNQITAPHLPKRVKKKKKASQGEESRNSRNQLITSRGEENRLSSTLQT